MTERPIINLGIARHVVLLWIIAVLITLGSAYYQRATGPNHPAKGKVSFSGKVIRFKLLRSEIVNNDAPVRLNVSDAAISGFVQFCRYKSHDDWSTIPLRREEGILKAELPHQPPAGKLMYLVHLTKNGETVSLTGDEPVILRYNGPVPSYFLIPHIFLMFLAMLFSNAAALHALDPRGRSYRYMLITIVLFFIGGMILGPVVQKYAFGAFWTGIPFGYDLTDNKTLIAMIGWLFAWFMNRKGRDGRIWIICAAILMLVIFLIPHSVLGSEIDHTKISR